MAGILSVATTAAHCAIQAAQGIHRLAQAVITFNSHMVGTMLRMLLDGCRAVVLLTSLLLEVVWIVALHILGLFLELARLFLIFFTSLTDLFAWLYRIGGLALSDLGVCLRWLTHGLLFMLQYVYKYLSNVFHANWPSSLTLVTIKKFFIDCFSTFYQYFCGFTVSVASSMCDYLLCIHQFICVGFGAVSSIVGSCWEAVYLFLLACYNLSSSAFSSAGNTLSSHLYDFSWHFSYEFHLTCLVTSFAIGLCMMIARLLHKRGFTCPLFLPSSNQIIQLEYNGEDEFLESDVDDAAQDDEDEDASEANEDSDVGDMDEYSIGSSEEESEEEENDDTAINIHLPEGAVCSSLRSCATPSPCSSDNLSSRDLEKHLESERDKRMCVVCVDQVKTVLVLPCKHMCLCIDCAREIAQSRFIDRRVCPLCREPMATVMYIYV